MHGVVTQSQHTIMPAASHTIGYSIALAMPTVPKRRLISFEPVRLLGRDQGMWKFCVTVFPIEQIMLRAYYVYKFSFVCRPTNDGNAHAVAIILDLKIEHEVFTFP